MTAEALLVLALLAGEVGTAGAESAQALAIESRQRQVELTARQAAARGRDPQARIEAERERRALRQLQESHRRELDHARHAPDGGAAAVRRLAREQEMAMRRQRTGQGTRGPVGLERDLLIRRPSTRLFR